MKTIELKNDILKQCPKCSGKLEYQNEWDSMFDKYDQQYHSYNDVIKKLHQDNQPKYICNQCNTRILATP